MNKCLVLVDQGNKKKSIYIATCRQLKFSVFDLLANLFVHFDQTNNRHQSLSLEIWTFL